MTKKFLAIILMTVLAVSVFAQDKNALTQKETKFKEKVLDKKGIDPADDWAMERLWQGYLAMGITGAVVGGGLALVGTILLPLGPIKSFTVNNADFSETRKAYIEKVYGKNAKSEDYEDDPNLQFYGDLRKALNNSGERWQGLALGVISSVMVVSGCIISPILCYYGFSGMDRTNSIYRKTTGQRLFSFLQRTTIGGGYNWENKEVTMAMAIKL